MTHHYDSSFVLQLTHLISSGGFILDFAGDAADNGGGTAGTGSLVGGWKLTPPPFSRRVGAGAKEVFGRLAVGMVEGEEGEEVESIAFAKPIDAF